MQIEAAKFKAGFRHYSFFMLQYHFLCFRSEIYNGGERLACILENAYSQISVSPITMKSNTVVSTDLLAVQAVLATQRLHLK